MGDRYRELKHSSVGTGVAVAFLSALLVAFTFLLASCVRRAEYERIRTEGDAFVATISDTDKIVVDEARLQETPRAIEGREQSAVSVRSSLGTTTAVQYFRRASLVATDRFDESGRLARRDLFDAAGRPRVRVFYGPNGDQYLVQYVDTKGMVLYANVIGMPFTVPRLLYPSS